MSLPRRIPPSQMIAICPPTSWATGSTSSIGVGASSSWRPPWFDNAIPATPEATACLASATVWIPFSTMGPSQIERSHSTSSHDSDGSNWDCTWPASETAVLPSSTPLSTTFENVIGSARRKSSVQPGWNAPSNIVSRPILGGSVKPRRTSRSRRPSTAVSTVSHSASYPAAAERSTSSRTRPRSRQV